MKTDRDMVLADWPGAWADDWSQFGWGKWWVIYDMWGFVDLGSGQTESEAWADAARRIEE